MVQQILDSWEYPDVRLGNDKGSLRLQFSSRVSRKYYGKKQMYKGLGRSDNPNNRKWAKEICKSIQEDLDYRDCLFDPTLKKYFYNVNENVINFPKQKELPILGESFLSFAERQYKLKIIVESTYKGNYLEAYSRLIRPWKNKQITRELAEEIIATFNENDRNKSNKKDCVSALLKMCDWLIDRELLAKNPFKGLESSITKKRNNIKDNDYLGEHDYRSFSKEERDLIIRSFYESHREAIRNSAPLIEFLFLTGARPCEVFPLTWSDIRFDNKMIVFSKSYESRSKSLKNETKNGTSRLFPFTDQNRLEKLLINLKEERYRRDDNALIFTNLSKNKMNNHNLYNHWYQTAIGKKGSEKYYVYDGIVLQLAKEGKINQYLKLYATRHTFISLQIYAALDNPNDKANFISRIKLVADAVGNSVQTIQNHYLDRPRDLTLLEI